MKKSNFLMNAISKINSNEKKEKAEMLRLKREESFIKQKKDI